MSWEDEWPLPVWPSLGEVVEALASVVARAGIDTPEVTHERWLDDDDGGDAAEEDTAFGKPGFGVEDLNASLPTESTITLVFQFPVDEALAIAVRLDPSLNVDNLAPSLDPPRGELDWEAAERAGVVHPTQHGRGIDPDDAERFTTRPVHYTVALDLVGAEPDEERAAIVRTYSNEYDNREAYPVLVVIADALATALTAITSRS